MTTRLTVELDEGVLPRGRILLVDGSELRFAGWVELAAAIERARDLLEPTLQAPSPQG